MGQTASAQQHRLACPVLGDGDPGAADQRGAHRERRGDRQQRVLSPGGRPGRRPRGVNDRRHRRVSGRRACRSAPRPAPPLPRPRGATLLVNARRARSDSSVAPASELPAGCSGLTSASTPMLLAQVSGPDVRRNAAGFGTRGASCLRVVSSQIAALPAEPRPRSPRRLPPFQAQPGKFPRRCASFQR